MIILFEIVRRGNTSTAPRSIRSSINSNIVLHTRNPMPMLNNNVIIKKQLLNGFLLIETDYYFGIQFTICAKMLCEFNLIYLFVIC